MPAILPKLLLMSLILMQLASCASIGHGTGTAASMPPDVRAMRSSLGAIGPSEACLKGTFVQLIAQDTEEDRWKRLFEEFKRVGLEEVVVQWSVLDQHAFHHPAPTAHVSVIGQLMRLAHAHDMKVWLGLYHDPRWWRSIVSPRSGSYLAQLRERHLKTAEELVQLLRETGTEHVLRGWYISEEIDDLNWSQPPRAALLHEHVHELSTALRRLTPHSSIGISGFVNASRTDPSELAAQWDALLARAPEVSTVFLQDGIGVGHLTLDILPAYVNAMNGVAKAHARGLHIVVELFEQTSRAEPGVGFQARPAKISRVMEQLRVAQVAGGPVFGFAVPNYMSAEAGAEAERLLADYLAACR